MHQQLGTVATVALVLAARHEVVHQAHEGIDIAMVATLTLVQLHVVLLEVRSRVVLCVIAVATIPRSVGGALHLA